MSKQIMSTQGLVTLNKAQVLLEKFLKVHDKEGHYKDLSQKERDILMEDYKRQLKSIVEQVKIYLHEGDIT